MSRYDDESDLKKIMPFLAIAGIFLLFMIGYLGYAQFRVDVPSKHIAVMTLNVGDDIGNNDEISPDKTLDSATHKGLQREVLAEGRHFFNPYVWNWDVYPMLEVPSGKLGVRVRLYGDDLEYGHYMAVKDTEKGIVEEVLRPGRYAINAALKGSEELRPKADYVEIVELHAPVTIPAGYKGVVTNLAGDLPEDPNVLLVPHGRRGVQKEMYEPGTYYVNPYTVRINSVDCRSQRFNLSTDDDMGFPSKDGFWISLDGIIEFRIKPEKAAEAYVTYNDSTDGDDLKRETISKIIMPNARAFCRLRGSDFTGRDFIGGESRIAFQEEFQKSMRDTCDPLGIEIIQALITRIKPPDAIASPVRDREVSHQMLGQYKIQIDQQDSEVKLAIEKELINRKKELIDADREVVKMVTQAMQEQAIAVTKAEENLSVAQFRLDATKDEALAITAGKKAEAGVIEFANAAEAAGWKKAVEALGGNGEAFARYVLFQKLAPGYHSIMTNTADSPLMRVFDNFTPKNAK